METIVKIAAEYGFLGLVLLAMAFYIWQKEKWHKQERCEWRDQAKEQYDKLLESNGRVISVISDLKGTLRSIDRAVNKD